MVSVTKESLIQAINGILGKEGDKISRKISESEDTPEGLKAAVHQCQKITKLTVDNHKHEQLSVISAALLKDLEDAARPDTSGEDTVQQERKFRMAKAKMITIAARIIGNGPDGLKITAKLRNAPASLEGLKGSLRECEQLASLTTNPDKVSSMKLHCEKILEELA